MLIPAIAALVPALILLYYVYHKDINPEPVRLVVKGFFYGALATFASGVISGPLLAMGFFTLEPQSFWECIKVSFLGAAIPEECAKLFMLWLLLRNCPEFDERYDGIVYAVAVGLGFAAFENIQYVVAAGAEWFSVSMSRAIFAVPGHFAFAVVMGYYYSVYHFGESVGVVPAGSREVSGVVSAGSPGRAFTNPSSARVKMLLYPILLHGVYDSIVFIIGLREGLSAIFTAILLFFCFRLFKATRKRILTAAAAAKEESDPSSSDSFV